MTQSQRLLNIFFLLLQAFFVNSELTPPCWQPLSQTGCLERGAFAAFPRPSRERPAGPSPVTEPPLALSIATRGAALGPAPPPSAGGAPPAGPALPTWSHLYGAGRGRAAGAVRRDGRPGRRLQRLPFVSGDARAVGAGGREGARAAELRPSLGSRPQPAAGRGRRRSGPSPASPARGEEGAGSAEELSGDRREEAGPGCPALWKLGAGGGGEEGPSPAESSRVRSQLEPPRRGLAAPGPTFVGVAGGGVGAAAGAGAARRSPPGAGGRWAGMEPQPSPWEQGASPPPSPEREAARRGGQRTETFAGMGRDAAVSP